MSLLGINNKDNNCRQNIRPRLSKRARFYYVGEHIEALI
jgi:hypothetical protein